MAVMNAGTRRYGQATLSVGIPRALPERMQGRVRELVAVYVPEGSRRRGLATELMNRTVREASRAKMTLILSVDEEPLKAFYARFGFTVLQSTPKILMVRRP